MIVGYARISTDGQDMALQMDALKEAKCEKVFSDTMSGARNDRPGLEKCLGFLQKGDTLVVWKLDRLGRDLRHLVNTVLALGERSVGFRVISGQGASIDTTTAAGKMVFGIFAALADFERSLIVDRVNAGIRAARERGVKFGPPVKLTPEIINQAKQMKGTASVRSIAKHLGVSKSALYLAMRDTPSTAS